MTVALAMVFKPLGKRLFFLAIEQRNGAHLPQIKTERVVGTVIVLAGVFFRGIGRAFHLFRGRAPSQGSLFPGRMRCRGHLVMRGFVQILGLDRVPLLCAREVPVPGALPRVIRVLVHYYASEDHEPRHVYLGEARSLRSDLESAQ